MAEFGFCLCEPGGSTNIEPGGLCGLIKKMTGAGKMRLRDKIAIALAAILVAGILFTWWAAKQIERAMREDLA